MDENGFTATATLLVAEKAKVSRGALLHHFPTRTDLLLCVVKIIFDDDVANMTKFLEGADRTSEEIMQSMGDSLNSLAGVAFREILQGARSDPVLLKGLARLQAQLERGSVELAVRIGKLGENGGDAVRTLPVIRLVHWCLRGLSNTKTLYGNPKDIPEVWAQCKRMFLSFQEQELPGKRRRDLAGPILTQRLLS